MSALIWLAIVAVWGFVLIPMWLRHHDSTMEQRSAERFTTAMRVLSRRGTPRPDREPASRPAVSGTDDDLATVSGPAHSAMPIAGLGIPGHRTPPHHISGGGRSVGGRPATSGRRRTDADRLALIRLRRQRLFVLLVSVPVTALLAGLFDGMWIVAQVLVDVGFVSYVIHLRRAAQVERRLRASRLARDRRIAAERAARRARQASGPGAVGGTVRSWAPGSEPFRLSDPVTVHGDAGAAGYAGGDAFAATTAETTDLQEIVAAAAAARSGWQPGVVEGRQVEGRQVVDDTVVDGPLTDGPVGENQVVEGAVDPVAVTGDPRGYAEVADTDGVPEAGEFEDAAEAVDGADSDQGFGQGSGAAGGGRPSARPGARPTTSRPGRVQVNPPGTHGGLTAGPVASDPGQPTADPEDPDDLDELLRRHAVGS